MLRCGERIMECAYVQRSEEDAKVLDVVPKMSKCQSFWEMLMILIGLEVWGGQLVHQQLSIIGDNTGALQNALELKGSGVMLAVAREIAWRRERRGWSYRVGHIPAEFNTIADALSRLFDEPALPFPRKVLQHAVCRSAPKVADLWRAVAFAK